jgi:hypothetical protein
VATDPRSDAINRYYRLGEYAPKVGAPDPWQVAAGLAPTASGTYNTGPNTTAAPAPAPAAPAPAAPAPTPVDWSSYLGLYGLPADVQKELNAIFTRTPDVNQATALALAYVRGTPWYAQTYPGIQEAIAKGIVRDEAGYRQAQNGYNQVFRQYNNRDLTAEEFAGYLKEGVSADTIGRRFQGAATATVYGNDWQYAEGNFGEGRLSDEEKTAYGRQTAGLDSELGQRVQRRLDLAKERIRTVFSGTLATSKFAEPLSQQSGSLSDVGR